MAHTTEQTATHTPGPWTLDGFRIMRIWPTNTKHSYEGAQSIADVAHDKQGLRRGHEENQSNARLIAAAPELLDALKAILPLAEAFLAKAPTHPDNGMIADARDSIAKAEGR